MRALLNRLLLLVALSVVLAACDAPALSAAQRQLALQVAQQVEAARLQADVETLVDVRANDGQVVPPWNDKPLSRVKSAEYVVAGFAAAGHAVQQQLTDDDGIECNNLWVELPGSGARAEEIIVLGAHYDTWFLGADDNATGIAVLLEAARVLPTVVHNRTIHIVAFDREEEGLIGAQRLADAYAERGANIVLVINLDAVGFSDPTPGAQTLPTGIVGPDRGDFLAVLANGPAETFATQFAQLSAGMPTGLRLPVEGILGVGDNTYPATKDFQRSDHAPFWRQGVPGLFLTDTANFRNPNYHTADDLPATLDYDFLHKVAALTLGAVAAFAQ